MAIHSSTLAWKIPGTEEPGRLYSAWGRKESDMTKRLRFLSLSLVAQLVKNPPAMWETWICTLGWEDPLEKGKATHSSILAWRIQSMGSQRVGHNSATVTHILLPDQI